jgi:hypothetical protein
MNLELIHLCLRQTAESLRSRSPGECVQISDLRFDTQGRYSGIPDVGPVEPGVASYRCRHAFAGMLELALVRGRPAR